MITTTKGNGSLCTYTKNELAVGVIGNHIVTCTVLLNIGHTAHSPNAPSALYEGSDEGSAVLILVGYLVSRYCASDRHLLVIIILHSEGINISVVEVSKFFVRHISIMYDTTTVKLNVNGNTNYTVSTISARELCDSRLVCSLVDCINSKLTILVYPSPCISGEGGLFGCDKCLCLVRKCSAGIADEYLAHSFSLICGRDRIRNVNAECLKSTYKAVCSRLIAVYDREVLG